MNSLLSFGRQPESSGLTSCGNCVKLYGSSKNGLQTGVVPFSCRSTRKGVRKSAATTYRTITIIVHASKILLKIIVNRIKSKYSTEISEEQAGFV